MSTIDTDRELALAIVGRLAATQRKARIFLGADESFFAAIKSIPGSKVTATGYKEARTGDRNVIEVAEWGLFDAVVYAQASRQPTDRERSLIDSPNCAHDLNEPDPFWSTEL